MTDTDRRRLDREADGADIDPYLWDGSGEPDPAVARLEGALAGVRWSEEPAAGVRAGSAAPGGRKRWSRLGLRRAGLAVAASLALVAGGFWLARGGAGTDWKLEALAGKPGLGGRVVTGPEAVPLDRWLKTDATSTALLRSDSVGRITVGPDSAVRLVRAAHDEHRLELARGSISASVTTPPRVFFVETPAATAVDMGCAYKLNVDETGAGTLYVSLGWVDLESGHRVVRVPAGAACRIGGKAGANPGPGTPWFEDAEPEFRTAVDRLDAGGGGLDGLLAAARVRDSLTLWHLAARLEGPARERVGLRLAELVPPPTGVDLARLDEAALEGWWGAVRASW